MHTVQFTHQAQKSFDTLMLAQPQFARRIAKAVDLLAEHPSRGIPLRGDLKGLYKYRVGVYRIIYEIIRSKLMVIIIDIGHRKDIYR